MKRTIFIITLFLISFLSGEDVMAQSNEDLALAGRMYGVAAPKAEYKEAKTNKNEVESVFSAMFLFYKAFISSQDGQSCSFTPSCSEFGLQAVKKQGPFIGVLNTIDRLTRCNSLSPQKYSIHPDTHLLYDPL